MVYICQHLGYIDGKCCHTWHTWILWVMFLQETPGDWQEGLHSLNQGFFNIFKSEQWANKIKQQNKDQVAEQNHPAYIHSM